MIIYNINIYYSIDVYYSFTYKGNYFFTNL